MGIETTIILIIAGFFCLVAGIVSGFFLGQSYRKRIAEAKVGSAEKESALILENAAKEAEA
ncbi:MAG: ribonuclease Y, partial [Clostridiales bacterium]|nr:ribonuclease Y [Clostridiales bacterium]